MGAEQSSTTQAPLFELNMTNGSLHEPFVIEGEFGRLACCGASEAYFMSLAGGEDRDSVDKAVKGKGWSACVV